MKTVTDKKTVCGRDPPILKKKNQGLDRDIQLGVVTCSCDLSQKRWTQEVSLGCMRPVWKERW